MGNVSYLKEKPIAVLGAGAVGKACAADCALAGQHVRIFDMEPFAKKTLFGIKEQGITTYGRQRNLYGFDRVGKAEMEMVTTDLSEAVSGAGLIIIGIPAFGHEPFFRQLIPLLEDGQVIHIIPDNFGSLLFRRLMEEMGCTTKVIVGGWSSAPYGCRVEVVGGFTFPRVHVEYRAITLRGASQPMSDADDFIESTYCMGCFDAITKGNGPVKADTALDVGFSNVNPVIHVPGTVLGVSTMENWGKLFGSYDNRDFSIYSHAFCPSISNVQYAFYNEEIALANAIGVGIPTYDKEQFFSRKTILAEEFMGPGNFHIPLDVPEYDAFGTGPNTIMHRYVTEDVPVGCKVYHELGKVYNVPTPIIDAFISLASAMVGKDYFNEGYSLEYLGIAGLSKEGMLKYLHEGIR
ncbi:Opine dehydrogenase [Eubacterium callanderi]|uniref:NAD/NADP-dependent octopine/nopaline dehydrogenase family protein n=1 Tax=Eubacterium callanderi TaxID=53442 RepID=UPI0029FF0DE0|nr:NAD/NADP octopine/nopaline dehydrogenase family protein [Eubacterium callanderi]WPK69184.1 Opine dehydrogenase [Eubacterium callanderi]WPK73482.1 Opine dehydrogenase [Eubacterium callanderi]